MQQKRIMRKRARRMRAHQRVRNRVQGTAERPRLSVFKSLRYIYAQVIDDRAGTTLAQASSFEADVRSGLPGAASNRDAAKAVGAAVAARAIEKGIKKVVFDRGGFVYHGRIQALADAARENGLEF
ncbi:MAG: 50S ribosomal protein L18 [Acidobacteriota bacterium]|nr:50S ribosomal protein L18 [Acidobacteriota bacterium]